MYALCLKPNTLYMFEHLKQPWKDKKISTRIEFNQIGKPLQTLGNISFTEVLPHSISLASDFVDFQSFLFDFLYCKYCFQLKVNLFLMLILCIL